MDSSNKCQIHNNRLHNLKLNIQQFLSIWIIIRSEPYIASREVRVKCLGTQTLSQMSCMESKKFGPEIHRVNRYHFVKDN